MGIKLILEYSELDPQTNILHELYEERYVQCNADDNFTNIVKSNFNDVSYNQFGKGGFPAPKKGNTLFSGIEYDDYYGPVYFYVGSHKMTVEQILYHVSDDNYTVNLTLTGGRGGVSDLPS